jgi:flagellar motor switch/type III secretory pathway protein FliN
MNAVEVIHRYGELPMMLEGELGRCVMPVREILALAPGSVVKLQNPAGGKVQVLVGGAPFAAGELVKSGGTTAIRLLTFPERKA